MGQKKSDIESITGRRLKQLADENRELRDYVAQVMKRLRTNEQLFSRMFELESQVLKASDPEDLCFTLLRSLRSGFELDFVRFWFDRGSFMGGVKLDALSQRDLVWLEAGEIERMGLSHRQTCLLQLSTERGFDWLTGQDQHLGSLALLVLGDTDRPFGVLGLGSIDRDRFAPNQSTDFLQHLAQVVGLTLENSVTRDRLARLTVSDNVRNGHNRRFLQPNSHQPLSQWFGLDSCVACLYVDVDHFKAINEAVGHTAGDELLTGVQQAIRHYIRTQDPLIRMGVDEFAVLLPGCSEAKAEEIGHRIVDACGQLEAQGERITVSIGMAFVEAGEEMAVKQLIENADQAMYVAKALGGSRLEKGVREPDAV